MIELLVAIGILAIIFTISVPNYGFFQQQQNYRAEVQEIYDAIADARNNALVSKKCSDGSESEHWETRITTTAGTPKIQYSLRCKPLGGSLLGSGFTQLEWTNLKNLNITQPISGANLADSVNERVSIGFVSGSAQARTYYVDVGASTEDLISEELEFEFEMKDNPDEQASICMNTIGSYLEMSEKDWDCTDDL